jgi:hypothetical protein
MHPSLLTHWPLFEYVTGINLKKKKEIGRKNRAGSE